MNLSDYNSLVQISAAKTDDQAIQELSVAVGYVGPDGTKKLCGDRCLFHIEAGKYKDRCSLLAKDIVVPDIASCTYYAKGESADKWEAVNKVVPAGIFTPEQVGLVIGRVQCKRCIRSNGNGICNALTDVIRKVLGIKQDFKIDKDACCNWNKSKGQKEVK